MKCPYCHREIKDGEKKCPKCYAAIPADEKKGKGDK